MFGTGGKAVTFRLVRYFWNRLRDTLKGNRELLAYLQSEELLRLLRQPFALNRPFGSQEKMSSLGEQRRKLKEVRLKLEMDEALYRIAKCMDGED
ncbi:hypothetical protein E3A20_06190 [Planctomyces bekefii]|uniref:Uncharacterized protein n=1 Tax=Planctomyces bekefii TaxID=1653850 RepID=A0A5C6M9H3_9PLAN|nr:hypothetical protein E3A20_06190 [Planctomyces bekefii]